MVQSIFNLLQHVNDRGVEGEHNREGRRKIVQLLREPCVMRMEDCLQRYRLERHTTIQIQSAVHTVRPSGQSPSEHLNRVLAPATTR
jgi:hypothetical protein